VRVFCIDSISKYIGNKNSETLGSAASFEKEAILRRASEKTALP